MANKKSTSKTMATTASAAMKNPKAGRSVKQLAGSALSQVNRRKQTSRKLETLAGRVLNDPKSSEVARKLAASVLTQGVR